MKNVLCLFLFLVLITTIQAQGIEFYHGNWKEALAEAKKQDKIIFVDAYAKWCGPCKKMAKNVFTRDNVGDFFNENFINLKLDMEETDGISFGRNYPVSAFPTLFFLDIEGNILKKVVGGQSDVGLIELGKAAIKSYDRSGDFATQYEAGDRSFKLVYSYIAALNQVDKPSLKIANDYWASDHDMTHEEKGLFLMEAVQEADSKLFDALLEYKKEAIKATSKEAYQLVVEKAAMATVNKAVEYDYKELYDEALEKFKAAGVGDYNQFKTFATLNYYQWKGDYDAWKEETKTALKKYGKKDLSLYTEIIQTLRNDFKFHNDALPYSVELAKTLVKKEDTGDHSYLYLQLLMTAREFDEAKKHIDVAIKNARDRKEDISRFERLKSYLDNM